jgi:hypothetical protein
VWYSIASTRGRMYFHCRNASYIVFCVMTAYGLADVYRVIPDAITHVKIASNINSYYTRYIWHNVGYSLLCLNCSDECGLDQFTELNTYSR